MYPLDRIALTYGVDAYPDNSPEKGVFNFFSLVSYLLGFRVWRFIEIMSPTVVKESARGS